jgi:hypothetical protein
MQDILFSVDHEDRSLAILSFFSALDIPTRSLVTCSRLHPPQRSTSQHRPLTPYITLSSQGALLYGGRGH